MNFALITEGLTAFGAVAAVLAGAKFRAGLYFATWASKRVARFFNERR